MKRRDFLKKAAATTAVAGASLAFGAPAVHAAKKYQWKMATTWPPNFPVFGESANFIAKWIEEMSEGRLKIHVYAGGELVPALQAFDAVGQGMVEM
ncbi:twin-arginine translocation signal domain-containing protein, partial [Deferribacterales bacterium Es71-Z0220]|uniref:twin-arginine translocation signal domain-containing protein n=1 Tax=Deferrivibrio essentukiensis TaxID=2880922 RepID=UPI001F6208D3